jgi:sugar (pentulose or hexulose) kinase
VRYEDKIVGPCRLTMKSISDMVWRMLSHTAVIGIDIGTSSSKGVLVAGDGEMGEPVHPAILDGIDTRATAQIARLTDRLGGPDALAAYQERVGR